MVCNKGNNTNSILGERVKILCGGPISEDPDIFDAHINSLLSQGYEMDYKGIDNSPEPLTPPQGFKAIVWRREQSTGEYKYNKRRWPNRRMLKVAEYREEMRLAGLSGDYDYLFMVDSDSVLEESVLNLLLAEKKDYITGLVWTRNNSHTTYFWPNAWDLGRHRFVKHTPEYIEKFKHGGVHQVDVTGACSLWSRFAMNNLSYKPIQDTYAEDITLAVGAREMGIPLFIHAGVTIEHRRRR